jgi:2-amino-4-hydroxy-6-hydroxymethyldihydropteridine diphosphokinase
MAMTKTISTAYPDRLKFSQSWRTWGPHRVILGLGANRPGRWGGPEATLTRAGLELARLGLAPLCRSRLYVTAPVGVPGQPDFVNAVVVIQARLSPAALLRTLKHLERQAGRRYGRPWGPRPLDIDIIDYAGRRLGWPPARGRRGRLILPHPHAHRRAFVLKPLSDIAPHWRHPVIGASARALLAQLKGPRRAQTVKPLISERSRAKSHPR